MNNSIILNAKEIAQKTKRIAFQILETLDETDEIILAGITGNGFIFAKNIQKELNSICDKSIILCEVFIDKKNPLATISTSIPTAAFEHKNIVLIDDVLSSGKTLIYGVKHFLNVPLTSFKTAVLVNRNHKKFPVKADFKGISLSTSLQEHIEVDFSLEVPIAYLCDTKN